MLTKRLTLLPATLCMSAVLMAGGVTQASAEDWPTMNITFSSALPEGGLNLAFEWWADELERRTDGAITTSRHYSASLMGAGATLPALSRQRIEAGYMAAAYFPGEYPLWNVAGVPFQTDDPVAQVRAFYELYHENEAFRAEWERNGVHLLVLQPLPHGIMGSREPINSVDDLQGKRLRMVGYVAAALEELGVETVGLRPEELYESIQRGVVSGYGAWPFDLIPVSALHEVAPYKYDLGFGHYASAAIGVSKRWWDSLDPKVQDLMTEIAEEFMFESGLPLIVQMEEDACDRILEHGGSVTVFSDEDIATMEELVGTASVDRWLAAATQRGIDEQVAIEFREQFLEKYEDYKGQVPYESGAQACAAR